MALSKDSEYLFYRLHKVIITCHLLGGYRSPMPPSAGKYYQIFLSVYVFLLNLTSLFCTLTMILGLMFVPDIIFERLCLTGACVSTLIYVTILGYMMEAKRKDFNNLTESARLIFNKCINDPLDVRKEFLSSFLMGLNPLRYYAIMSIPSLFVAASSVVLSTYIKSFKSLGFSGNTELAFPIFVGFEYDDSPNLEIAVAIELCGILIAGCRKLLGEILLLMYLHLLVKYLRHLKYTLMNVFSETTVYSPQKPSIVYEDQDRKLKLWIILHQDIMKFAAQITEIYNMILALYMVSLTVITTLAAFSAVESTRNGRASVANSGAGFYYVTTMITFYLLCHFGTLIQYEGEAVAKFGYFSEWYFASKKTRNSLKIVFQRVQIRPQIIAFRSPNFDVSKGTFLTFVKSTVSFYLALLQFGDKFQNK